MCSIALESTNIATPLIATYRALGALPLELSALVEVAGRLCSFVSEEIVVDGILDKQYPAQLVFPALPARLLCSLIAGTNPGN